MSLIKNTYPNSLLKLLDLPNNYLISEKQMIDLIITKCERMNSYSNSRYKIPAIIYKQLLTQSWEINHANTSNNTTYIVRASEIKHKLKLIAIKSEPDNYVVLSSTFSDAKVYNISVVID